MRACALCKEKARAFCESDQASLCWSCDEKVHGANFLVARHSRTLLCHACQSLTPWKASGPKLGGRTVSFCESCLRRRYSEAGGRDHEDGDDEEEEEEERSEGEGDESGGDGDEMEEEEEVEDGTEGGDNQVVPWSSSFSSTTPPPPASCSSSEEDELSRSVDVEVNEVGMRSAIWKRTAKDSSVFLSQIRRPSSREVVNPRSPCTSVQSCGPLSPAAESKSQAIRIVRRLRTGQCGVKGDRGGGEEFAAPSMNHNP